MYFYVKQQKNEAKTWKIGVETRVNQAAICTQPKEEEQEEEVEAVSVFILFKLIKVIYYFFYRFHFKQ